MHSASMNSSRLMRVAAVLEGGKPRTTRQIVRGAGVCAVNSIIAELRANGAEISCERRRVGRFWRWYYTMTKGPDDA